MTLVFLKCQKLQPSEPSDASPSLLATEWGLALHTVSQQRISTDGPEQGSSIKGEIRNSHCHSMEQNKSPRSSVSRVGFKKKRHLNIHCSRNSSPAVNPGWFCDCVACFLLIMFSETSFEGTVKLWKAERLITDCRYFVFSLRTTRKVDNAYLLIKLLLTRGLFLSPERFSEAYFSEALSRNLRRCPCCTVLMRPTQLPRQGAGRHDSLARRP